MQPSEAVYEALIQQMCLEHNLEGATNHLQAMKVSF